MRLTGWICSNARAVVVAAAILSVVAASLAFRLELHAGLDELLPEDDPATVEIRRVSGRVASLQALVVVVESPNPKANFKLVDDLAREVRRLPDAGEVAWNARDVIEVMRSHRWLYMDVATLRVLDKRLREQVSRMNPFQVDLDDDAPPLRLVVDLSSMPDAGLAAGFAALPDGAFANQEGTFAALVVLPRREMLAESVGPRLVESVRSIVSSLDPARYGPSIRVGYAGSIVLQIEERAALEQDLTIATGITVVLVLLMVFLFYRRWVATPLVMCPAAIGTLFALAVAKLWFGYLNTSTGFLGAIILGNGINFAIIQFARYAEERSRGAAVRDALAAAVSSTLRPTLIAALSATAAYSSLLVTRFRGFSQFGLIGGFGMAFSWLATFTVLPALVWLLDRERAAVVSTPHPQTAPRIVRFLTGHTWAAVIVGLLLTLAAIAQLRPFATDPFEYDFRNLRNARSETSGEGVFSARLHGIFGRALDPTIVLADSPTDIAEIAERLDEGAPLVEHVVTLGSIIPGNEWDQRQKIELLADIRRLALLAIDRLRPDERKRLLAELPPPDLQPLRAEELPPIVRRPFSETNGTIGRIVLVYPTDKGFSVWNGKDLLRFAERVQEIPLQDGRTARATGTATLFAAMIRSILRDGPRATLASVAAVVCIVAMLLGSIRLAMVVLANLGVGMIWMLGAAAASGVRLNFLNFVAIPITLGIGVDYAVNVSLRYRAAGPEGMTVAVRNTGAAVALCSMTTIIGYGSLLLADSRALRSFGTLAVLGEIACLSAALALLPSMLRLLGAHQQPGMR